MEKNDNILDASMVNKALFSDKNKEALKSLLEKFLESKVRGVGFLNNSLDNSKTTLFVDTENGHVNVEVSSKVTPLPKHTTPIKTNNTLENNINDGEEDKLVLKINNVLNNIVDSLDDKQTPENNDEHLIVLALEKETVKDFCIGYKLIEKFKNIIECLSDKEIKNILNPTIKKDGA